MSFSILSIFLSKFSINNLISSVVIDTTASTSSFLVILFDEIKVSKAEIKLKMKLVKNFFPENEAITLLGFLENLISRFVASRLVASTPAQIRETAMSLLGRVGLSHKADSYPYQLSGGQQQRVAIARALALQPEVLCFDEPTSALDPELTGEVLKVIRSLKGRDNTMVVVTHEMEFARSVADVVIYMADGVIEEFGTPEEVFGNPRSEKTRNFLQGAQNARDGLA